MNLGDAQIRIEGSHVYVFDTKDLVIPEKLYKSTKWTKGGQVDKRFTVINRAMLDWIEQHQ